MDHSDAEELEGLYSGLETDTGATLAGPPSARRRWVEHATPARFNLSYARSPSGRIHRESTHESW